MLDWEITVLRGENGFSTRWLEELDNGNVIQKHEFFQTTEIDGDMREALICCLSSLIEYFGLLGSKHDKKRIVVDFAEDFDD